MGAVADACYKKIGSCMEAGAFIGKGVGFLASLAFGPKAMDLGEVVGGFIGAVVGFAIPGVIGVIANVVEAGIGAVSSRPKNSVIKEQAIDPGSEHPKTKPSPKNTVEVKKESKKEAKVESKSDLKANSLPTVSAPIAFDKEAMMARSSEIKAALQEAISQNKPEAFLKKFEQTVQGKVIKGDKFIEPLMNKLATILPADAKFQADLNTVKAAVLPQKVIAVEQPLNPKVKKQMDEELERARTSAVSAGKSASNYTSQTYQNAEGKQKTLYTFPNKAEALKFQKAMAEKDPPIIVNFIDKKQVDQIKRDYPKVVDSKVVDSKVDVKATSKNETKAEAKTDAKQEAKSSSKPTSSDKTAEAAWKSLMETKKKSEAAPSKESAQENKSSNSSSKRYAPGGH